MLKACWKVLALKIKWKFSNSTCFLSHLYGRMAGWKPFLRHLKHSLVWWDKMYLFGVNFKLSVRENEVVLINWLIPSLQWSMVLQASCTVGPSQWRDRDTPRKLVCHMMRTWIKVFWFETNVLITVKWQTLTITLTLTRPYEIMRHTCNG